MTGNEIALDTSAAIRLLNDQSLAQRFLPQFTRACLPAIAVGELLYGARNSQRHAANLPRYRAFVEQCVILDITGSTAEIYATVRQQLKTSGTPIPDSDIWIAAAAMEHQLPLASYDAHFKHIEGLTVVS